MTNYQLIFRDPHSIDYWGFNYWLTDVVGGIWLSVFGQLGLFGIRLAASLLILSTNLLVYRLYRGWISDTTLLIAILFGETFIERMYWLNYDNLSAFLFVVGAFFMIRGLVQEKLGLMFWAGFTLGLNIFARLTNVAGVIVIASIVLTAFAVQSNAKQRLKYLMWKQSVTWLSGVIVGVVVVVSSMAWLGHLHDFLHNASTLFSIAGGQTNTHSSHKLLSNFWHDQTVALRTVFWALAFTVWITLGNACLKRFALRFGPPLFTAASMLLAAFCLFRFEANRYYMVAGLTGLLYAVLVYFVVVGIRRKEKMAVAASAVALLTLIAAPLGSDLGIRLSVYGMYLALPIGMKWFIDQFPRSSALLQLGWTRMSLRVGVVVLLVGIFANAVITSYHYTYRDASDRLTMRFPVNDPKLHLVYTTKARAAVVNSLLTALPQYVHPGDVLFDYEESSMVYYLTNTRPYLNTSWPMLYSPKQLQMVLHAAVQTHQKLPVALRATGATADGRWPEVKHLRTGYPHDADRVIINRFLVEHHYHVVWQNEFFQILVPDGRPQLAK